MTTLIIILIMAVATFLAASGSLFLKKGANVNKGGLIGAFKNYWLWLGGFFYVVSSTIFVILLKSTELSFLYPLNAIAYVWAAILSIKYLNERMTSLKWLGIILIIIGVFFVAG